MPSQVFSFHVKRIFKGVYHLIDLSLAIASQNLRAIVFLAQVYFPKMIVVLSHPSESFKATYTIMCLGCLEVFSD
jgi:hypothetical protein